LRDDLFCTYLPIHATRISKDYPPFLAFFGWLIHTGKITLSLPRSEGERLREGKGGCIGYGANSNENKNT
jgi:hypothetical protein